MNQVPRPGLWGSFLRNVHAASTGHEEAHPGTLHQCCGHAGHDRHHWRQPAQGHQMPDCHLEKAAGERALLQVGEVTAGCPGT